MRFVSWNMGCGGKPSKYRKTHAEAWRYLLDKLGADADVVLVQEALRSSIADNGQGRFVVMNKPDGLDAGTAVLVRGAEAVEGDLITAEESYVVNVRIGAPAASFNLVAVHVYPGKKQQEALRSLVDKLSAAATAGPVLVAGDFNSARHFDTFYGTKKHKWFFAEMEEKGLHDVHWGIHRCEKQSFWGHQTTQPYQDDHVFVSNGWASRVKSCEIIDNETVRRLSDHGPVVFEVDVSR